ncbi:gephyrin isoform X1 [Rhopalosiphum padi]|uniref:gephyrin isoform X1 n=2 Tax=Rhopalosiphum padi TaxID=40932 RepID=UPI00298EA173|nr:gephyrin isoform X1 [Rhopalosiphum padi]
MDFEKPTIKVGILTISDTRTPSASNIDSIDSSGHNLIKLINDSNVIESAKVVQYDCVTDDYDQIQAKMSEWCSERKVDVLLSTGGTGFSSRDVTPEATLGLVQKLTPGISQAIMNESLKLTPMAMLSRAVSGIYEKTLIINLPGSTKASKECLYVVARAIPHAVSLIKDETEISKQFHKQLDFTANNESKVPECVTKIACRHRESQFPKISMKSALNILKEHAVLQYTENNKIKYPTIWIFSTGDELENISGYIRDTNSVMIKQILEQDHYKGQVFNFGIVRDNWDDLCKRFEEAFNNADIIVTSGGVSMGEKDLIKHVLKEHFKSKIHFGRVNMKPGMPTTFVTLFFKDKKKYIFCLPGNPVSAGVCTHLFLLPYLRSVSGKKIIIHSLKAKLTHSINDLDIRPEYRRALLKYENGELYVSCLTNYQQSSRLLSFVGSNCLLHLPSLSNEANIKSNTIMDVTLIKSIKNTYIAPILKQMNLLIEIFKKPTIFGNIKIEQSRPFSCIKNVLHLMTENIFVAKTENIPTDSAMGYVLYLPVNSSENLPPFPASIKDGYAIKYINEDSWSQRSNIFNVVQVSVAGTVPACQKEIKEGECARISTGAPLPPGANCVVQVEDTAVVTKSSDGKVELTIAILKEPKLFENIRSIGSDISVGQRLLDQKTVLGPFEIALLRSVGCDYVQVYKCPSIHIVPCNDNSAYAISHKLKNMLELADFKGNIFSHPLCKNLTKFSELFESVFDYDDVIIIICDSFYEFSNVVESHIHIRNNTRKISLGFGRMYYNEKKVVFLHIDICDLDSIYNCVHLFILPFLRFTTGKKNIISSIKTKCNMTSHYLPSDKFEKAELYYENGDFNVTCFTMNHQSCLVNMPSSVNEFNVELKEGKKTELDAIVTENSDSYFIYY